MYLTYDDYAAMGGTLTDEAAFNSLLYRAESKVDWYTFERLRNILYCELDIRVKRCVYEIIKLLQNADAANSLPTMDGSSITGTSAVGIRNQSNDGVSISYEVNSASNIMDRLDKDVEERINTMLSGVRDKKNHRVLYRGMYPDE